MKHRINVFTILMVCTVTVCFAYSDKKSSPSRHLIQKIFTITTPENGYQMGLRPGTQIVFDNSENANWIRPDGVHIRQRFVPSDNGQWFMVSNYSTGNTLFVSTIDHRTIISKIDLSRSGVENLTNCVWLPDNRRWVQVYGNSKGLYEVIRDINFPNSKYVIPLGVPRATNGWGGYSCILIAALNKNHVLALGSHTRSHHVLLFTFDTAKRSKILYTDVTIPDISHVTCTAYYRKGNKIAFLGTFDYPNGSSSFGTSNSEYRIVIYGFKDGKMLGYKSIRLMLNDSERHIPEAEKLEPHNLIWRENGSIQFVYHDQLYVIDRQ